MFDYKEILALSAMIIGVIAYAPYIFDIVKGKISPHPYSWLIWGVVSVIGFSIRETHGAGWAVIPSATTFIICFLIFVLSLRKGGKKLINKVDTVLLFAAFFALFVWLVVDQPLTASIILVVVEMIGIIPTVRKTWNLPYSETLTAWWLNSVRHLLIIFSTVSVSVITIIDPVIWVFMNTSFCVYVLILRRKRKQEKLRLSV